RQQVAKAGAFKPEAQHSAQVIAMAGQVFAERGQFERRERVQLIAVGRLKAEHLALGARVTAVKPAAATARFVEAASAKTCSLSERKPVARGMPRASASRASSSTRRNKNRS